MTGASEQAFPRISVQFEVKRPDGSFLLDAARDDFRVTEEGRDVDLVEFEAPRATEAIPTTVVLVVDRSLSMEEEDRIGGLKRAVGSFLEKLPEGSRVAVIAFGSDVDRLCQFHDRPRPGRHGRQRDRTRGRHAVLRRRLCRARDARARDRPPGRAGLDRRRRHVQSIRQPRLGDRRGAPARSAGLHARTGHRRRDRERRSQEARRVNTRPVLPGRDAGQLRAIYEQLAERIGASYRLVYQSDRKLPDGTLRPVRVVYHRGSRQSAGETAVFIPGMVVPSGGWSPLFLGLFALLTVLIFLPATLSRRIAPRLKS